MATIPLPSQVLSKRLAEMRGARGMHQQDLADEMTELGWSWVRTTVAKIEGGKRQVSVDELLSLAYVLGVTPLALITTQIPTQMQLMPSVPPVSSERVWQWCVGLNAFFDPQGGVEGDILMHPSSQGHADIDHEARQARALMYQWQRPTYLSDADKVLPGLSALAAGVARLQSLATSTSDIDAGKVHDEVMAIEDAITHVQSATQKLRDQENERTFDRVAELLATIERMKAEDAKKATK